MSTPQVFQPGPLERAIEAIVAAGGSDAREAKLVAENLVTANLTGHDSHGIGMIPRYVDSLKEGGLKPNRHPAVKFDGGALVALDGQAGYGQVIGLEATDIAIARAQQHGVCVMALANSHHLCRIGQWAEQAVALGLVSISFVNVISRAIVAPFGGSDARFGTNPCTIGIPLPGQPPFILDMATSGVAQGKMRVAHNKGEKVAPGLLIDDQGRPTLDPRFVVVEPFGALTTFGLHKGYGLAVVCELLGGALTGGGTWHTEDRSKKRVLNGMLSILIDPKRLGTAVTFEREAREFIAWVKQSPPAPGVDRVRIAGDPERETRARRERDGIAVDGNTWLEIHAAGAKVGVAAETIDRLARGG
ncbi:MAG: malate/lactate/ureidoglycolate dehydrogenase [Betaproteobacteria bacterium]|nr:malate/lactate/ureidoglycolate dehydrogenase [Betaproteobacteria bacterium]MDH5221584.1 malate/lactate/ureidoglycolate dehydrogenase [Betaproteobacteria bacterium]MDH5350434.1 malate/lactate/ureidoglycolate dehydrogenase [Betaproteobacteria bacterium]